MTHDKHRKKAIRDEAKRRGLPYQTVLEERWRPYDVGQLRDHLRREAQRFCSKRIPRWGSGDTERLEALIQHLLEIAVAPEIYRYFGTAREKVQGDAIGAEKTEACMHHVWDFVTGRDPHPVESSEVTAELTVALARIVCRKCPGHQEATRPEKVAEQLDYMLYDFDPSERLSDDD